MKYKRAKSVKSLNPYPSVILTFYDIVKAHGDGGDLSVKSITDKRATFFIQLPKK